MIIQFDLFENVAAVMEFPICLYLVFGFVNGIGLVCANALSINSCIEA